MKALFYHALLGRMLGVFPNPQAQELLKQATNFRNSGQINQAVKAYKALAKLAREEGDLKTEADAYHMAGVSCKEGIQKPGDEYFKKSLIYYERARDLAVKEGNKLQEGAILRDMAISHAYAKNFEIAIKVFEESIKVFESEADPAALGITLDKRGLVKMAVGDYSGAEEDMRQGLKEIRKGEHWFFEATALLDLARLMVKTKCFGKGVKLAKQALAIYKAHMETEPHPRRLAQIHGTLYQAYRGKGEEEQANIHRQEYEELLQILEPAAIPAVQKDIEELAP